MDPAVVRVSSWRQVEHEGLRSNPELLLLEADLSVRQSVQAIGTRILCMHAMAAHAFGFPLDATRARIDREGLRDSLSRRESGHTPVSICDWSGSTRRRVSAEG